MLNLRALSLVAGCNSSPKSSCARAPTSAAMKTLAEDSSPVFAAKSRPTMISAKYRLKEERRKVLKISISKLKKIEDPESSLRRSVLINNTMKKLQREAREEKLHKQQLLYSPTRCFLDDAPTPPPAPSPPPSPAADKENDPLLASRKRPAPADEECCDVLSQFYMPPTPRMLTSIDEDDDEVLNVVDVEPAPEPKRARLEADQQELERRLFVCGGGDLRSCCWGGTNNNNNGGSASDDVRLRLGDSTSQQEQQTQFSCGQASIFGELQSVVFHSLIASLES